MSHTSCNSKIRDITRMLCNKAIQKQILASNDILNAFALSTNDLNCPAFDRSFSISNSSCHSFALSMFYALPKLGNDTHLITQLNKKRFTVTYNS